MLKEFIKWIKFNLRYLWNTPWDTGITPPEVVDFLKNHPAGRALDLGAGTGTNMITLAKAGWEAVGVEYALLAFIRARKKIKRAGVNSKIYLHDVTHLNFLQDEFDLILDIGCFHSLLPEERVQYRKNLIRLLKPGGIFLLYAFLSQGLNQYVGISASEIKQFSQILQNQSENIGTERGNWDSVWLKFRKEK